MSTWKNLFSGAVRQTGGSKNPETGIRIVRGNPARMKKPAERLHIYIGDQFSSRTGLAKTNRRVKFVRSANGDFGIANALDSDHGYTMQKPNGDRSGHGYQMLTLNGRPAEIIANLLNLDYGESLVRLDPLTDVMPDGTKLVIVPPAGSQEFEEIC